jgi:hypothetical protein
MIFEHNNYFCTLISKGTFLMERTLDANLPFIIMGYECRNELRKSLKSSHLDHF